MNLIPESMDQDLYPYYLEMRNRAINGPIAPTMDEALRLINAMDWTEDEKIKTERIIMEMFGRAVAGVATCCGVKSQVQLSYTFDTDVWAISEHCPECGSWKHHKSS